MEMLAVHSAAIESKASAYHEFLLRYSRRSKVVYGFVEGRDDPTFYRGFIDLLLPEDWTVELWPAGGKDQVYRIHRDVDWRRFPKMRVGFFVDRDLSRIISEKLPADSNIYVTTGYSIENDMVNKAMCQRVLSELCGFGKVGHAELERICVMFEQARETFLESMIPVMAWILSWKNSGARPNLNDIQMDDLFFFKNGCIYARPTLESAESISRYVHTQCAVKFDPGVDIQHFIGKFKSSGGYRKYTRGKFLFWFLIEFCNAIHRDAGALFAGMSKSPKKNVTMSCSNGVAVIGPRARIPSSLREFIRSTYVAYAARVEARLAGARK